MDYTLFPPIIESKMPAFLKSEMCKIYFSLSPYNNANQITNCQVRLTYQNNNNSALNSTKYPSGIKLCNLSIDNSINTDAKYYVTIEPNDLINSIFDISQYYKVQIRFTGADAAPVNINTQVGIDAWLAANIQYFSEWSQVCLIKAISQPHINMLNFGQENDYISTFISNYLTVKFNGIVSFEDENDSEYVKSFKVFVYKDNTLINETTDIYPNPYSNINQLLYTTTFNLQPESQYIFTFQVTTNNLYIFSSSYTVRTNQDNAKPTNLQISLEPDPENGRMGIRVKNSNGQGFVGNIVIKRASSKNNFTDWNDIHITSIDNYNKLDYLWFDPTIQSGIFYMYAVQEIDKEGTRSKVSVCERPKLVEFQHMYLLGQNGKQLKIKFNPEVSSFQRIISQSKTETMGSKYPWFNRNGVINYRAFPIAGLISFFMDESSLLQASKEQLYGDYKEWYDAYNKQNNITPYNDYIYEKDFRDKVIDFLYEDNIKLFKSSTEGNIFVKLMEISLTPNTTLSRRIYSFTCMAYEADEFNLQNCLNKYNVLSLGQYSTEDIIHQESHYGQIVQTIPASTELISNYINKKYNIKNIDNYTTNVDYLSYLRIELTTPPYLIESDNGTLKKATKKNNEQTPSGLTLGHIVNINSTSIIIGENGIYELNGDNVEITSVSFADAEQGYIDYIAHTTSVPQPASASENVDSIYTYYNTIGQYWGEVRPQVSIFNEIADKYNKNYTLEDTEFNTHLDKIISLDIIAEPGSIFYIKQAQDTTPQKHIVGISKNLAFNGKETNIQDIRFGGIHLQKAPQGKESAREWEYLQTKIFIDSLQQLENPIFNGVYTLSEVVPDTIMKRNFIKTQRYIYYKQNWYPFPENDELNIPESDAIVNYNAIIYKGRG